MGTRSRLFASAAFPLLSLSLMFHPASAASLAGGLPVTAVPGAVAAGQTSFEVAQEAAPADGQDEQDPRKRKKPAGEAPKEEAPKQEAPKHEPAAEQKPAAEPEAPKPPKAEPAPEQPKPAAEAPKPPEPKQPEPKQAEPKQPEAKQPEAAPAAEAPVKKEHKQPAAEEAQPEAAPKPKAAAEPPAEAPAPPKKKPEQPAAAAPAAEAPAAQPEEPPAPKKHQKPQGQAAEPAEQPAAPAAPVAPAAPAGKPAAAEPEKPAFQKGQAEGKPPEPEGEAAPANGKPPAAAQSETGKAPPAPGTAPADAAKAPAKGTAPADSAAGQAAPAAPGTEQVSPAELERRKKIAENPAASPSAGPVILPVQNGAAVLDSDKDAARRGHGNGQGNGQGRNGQGRPADGGQPPAAGQAPAGQAPAVQGQAAQGQRPPAAANVRAPTSDADAQRAPGGAPPVQIQAVTAEQGSRMNQRPDFAAPDGAQVEDRQNSRVIINFGDDVFVRHDDTQRFTRDGERPSYEQLPRDRYRETIDRPDGDRIITVRNRYGDIIQRSRVDRTGREYVLFYSPELENSPDQDDYYRDPGDDLPPMRLRIPLNQYIIDTSEDQNQDYYDFLRKPPVEPVERVYSLNEVRYSARIRDKVRRIDLDTITFATGSADIPMAQAKTLRGIADAIGNIVRKDPTETFLIEGHTDAVGSDQSNLILSDQRAESVANVLTDVYGIPPENLATQGYGEQYLKVNTLGPEQENRRVTIRRVTALVRPVASRK